MKKGFLNKKPDNPFKGSKDLTTIKIPDDVQMISDNSFFYHSPIKVLVLPDSIDSIEKRAFEGLSKQTCIVAPERFHDQIRRQLPDNKILTKAQALQEGLLEEKDLAQASYDTATQSGPRP